MDPAIFISYPRQDSDVANKLRDALTSVSTEIDVLIDHAMIDPGDDYEEKISSGITRSKWFLLVCVGNFLVDRDMTWCYYEAGQFRQVLRANGLDGEQILCFV